MSNLKHCIYDKNIRDYFFHLKVEKVAFFNFGSGIILLDMKDFIKKDKNNIYWLISFYAIAMFGTLTAIGLLQLIDSL